MAQAVVAALAALLLCAAVFMPSSASNGAAVEVGLNQMQRMAASTAVRLPPTSMLLRSGCQGLLFFNFLHYKPALFPSACPALMPAARARPGRRARHLLL